jgi:hypothetical protein
VQRLPLIITFVIDHHRSICCSNFALLVACASKARLQAAAWISDPHDFNSGRCMQGISQQEGGQEYSLLLRHGKGRDGRKASKLY